MYIQMIVLYRILIMPIKGSIIGVKGPVLGCRVLRQPHKHVLTLSCMQQDHQASRLCYFRLKERSIGVASGIARELRPILVMANHKSLHIHRIPVLCNQGMLLSISILEKLFLYLLVYLFSFFYIFEVFSPGLI
jgi:hypothetical protein